MTPDQRIIEAAKNAAAFLRVLPQKDKWQAELVEAVDAAAVGSKTEHTVIEFENGEGRYYPEK